MHNIKKILETSILLSSIILMTACGQANWDNDADAVVTSGASPMTEQNIADGLPITEEATTRTESMLHTVVQFQIYHENIDHVIQEAVDYIGEMEALLSTNTRGSDIYNINQNAGIEPVKVNPATFENIERAIQIAEESDGLFDITIGGLTNLWQIGSEDARIPSEDEIKEAVSKIDYKKIALDEEDMTVFLEEEGMALELGGISKGYIGSGIAELFQENDITTGIINLGGNVVVMGTSPSNPEEGWNVGVQDPDQMRGDVVGTQRIKNAAIVTSGIYERYLEVDGVKYHHIMDPRTGYPLENEISGVTVFAPTSFDGDSYSTALFLMGISEGIEFIERKDGFEVAYIDKDGGVHLSSGIKDSFVLTNEKYHLAED